jgi:tetratricopeptide (TPR) repeat protein
MALGKALAIWILTAATLAGATAGDAEDCRNVNLKATRIEACSRLIAAHPDRDDALAGLFDLRAAAHGDAQDYSAQAADIGSALRLRPASAEALVQRGAAHFRADDADAALKDFNDAVVMAPQNASARLWRGRTYRKLGQLQNAEADLAAAVKLDAQDANAWMIRGLLLDDLKRHTEAIASYDRSVALAPERNAPLYNRAWSLLQLNRYADALRDIESCSKIDPDDADCFELKGQTLLEMNEPKRAAEAYLQAIARSPDSARLYRARAGALQSAGDFDGAIGALTKALELDADLNALYDRGWMYALSGRPDNAIADYSLILRREGADAWPSALIERGLARIIRGDISAAEADFVSARAVAPANARAALWRAALNIRLNQDSFWASWRRSDAAAALAKDRAHIKAERYEAPFVQAILGERSVAEAHRVAHMAAREAEDPTDAACFADTMAGALALADGDAKAAEGYFAKSAARGTPTSYACLIGAAELNRLRNR